MPEQFTSWRSVCTGKDGRIYVKGPDGNNIFLGECDTATLAMNLANTDFQPVGSYLSYAVPVSYSATLTISETVVRDDVMLKPIYDGISSGFPPLFDFSLAFQRRDGSWQRQVVTDCLPDNSVNLMDIQPGQIVKRAWTFRVNATPELQEYFHAA